MTHHKIRDAPREMLGASARNLVLFSASRFSPSDNIVSFFHVAFAHDVGSFALYLFGMVKFHFDVYNLVRARARLIVLLWAG